MYKVYTICKSNLFHRINIRYWLKIIPNNRTVFHTPCSIFFIRHIGKIRLHNSSDSVMGNQNVSFFFRFFPDIIEKIIDSLCQTKCRFSSLMAAGEEFFRLFKVLSIPRRGFSFSEILLDQSRFYPTWDSCHLRNQLCRIFCPAER